MKFVLIFTFDGTLTRFSPKLNQLELLLVSTVKQNLNMRTSSKNR